MNKFRVKLTLMLILLIGFSMLCAGVYMASIFEKSHITELKGNLVRELNVMVHTGNWNRVGEDANLIEIYTKETERLSKFTQARVTYVRSDGKVMGDSEVNPMTLDNHKERPEIQDALSHQIGFYKRYSDTIKENMLYAAISVDNDQGQSIGALRIAMSLAEVESTVNQLWVYLIVGMLILFLLVSFISYRFAAGITRPIEKITRVAQQITNRNYRARVNIRSKDEVGQLGHAVNRMSDSLQEQMNLILESESRLKGVLGNMSAGVMMVGREGNIVLLNPSAEQILGFEDHELLGHRFDEAKQQPQLIQLIEHCMEKQQPLREEMVFYYPAESILEVNAIPIIQGDDTWTGVLIVLHDITAIRRLEKMRSEFVANVSHELKTPIASVKGFAETLLAGAMNDPETAKAFLKIIYDESERLNRLIGDILALSKIESKRVPLQLSPVSLTTIIEDSIHMMQVEAEQKSIQLDMRVEGDLYLEADEDRLRQILINLLSNGINYTMDGGKVRIIAEPIRARSEDEEEYEHIRITVSDTGIGIPKSDLPRVFERFYRVDKARSRSSGGTGLGLSIVKHLVEIHHGTIQVESEIGIGTKFMIELPVIH
ncbi:cell wall metabolism sensor histidine kinase WalK [Paenibacillus sp. N1-5-1-14]|uniref:two-component system histidine kinase PnpS n=1 Tax=Paenibacillus radicibacter TaxID=2972488 RepID=UPI002158F32B|nr:cell wall metabolism sensor histidine kinase WalK [Paenibacillus radicibacter]MCR8643729.1 cell wall metabolism sensor histidine kinase WalK [Paenibacillus radicibacter]